MNVYSTYIVYKAITVVDKKLYAFLTVRVEGGEQFKLRKATICPIITARLSDCHSAWSNFIKISYLGFLQNSFARSGFIYNVTKIRATLHKDVRKFVMIDFCD